MTTAAALHNHPPHKTDCAVSSTKGIALLHSKFPTVTFNTVTVCLVSCLVGLKSLCYTCQAIVHGTLPAEHVSEQKLAAGHRASQRADHTIASTAVEALHAILLSSVLHSKQVLCVPTMVKDFDTAIKGLKGHHTAQLTASACLTQLCITEMEQSTNKRQVLIPHAQCHVSLSNQFATAVQQGAFDTVFDSVREAILVSCSAYLFHLCLSALSPIFISNFS